MAVSSNMTSRLIALLCAGIFAGAALPAQLAAQVSVVGPSIHEKEAAPGSAYGNAIVIRNEGSQLQRLRVYLTDYAFNADGTSNFGEAGRSVRSNAAWVSFGSETFIVPPGQSVSIPYTISVPPTPAGSGSGSYWSIAMIEGEAHVLNGTAQKGAVRIDAVVRQGIQLVTHVGSAAASVSFSNVHALEDGAGRTLRFDAANVGARARRLTLSVDLYSEDGALVGRYSRVRGLVYPGSSIRQAFTIGRLKSGNYLAFVVADAGDDDLFVGNFKLKL
jgi:hypothetical protein